MSSDDCECPPRVAWHSVLIPYSLYTQMLAEIGVSHQQHASGQAHSAGPGGNAGGNATWREEASRAPSALEAMFPTWSLLFEDASGNDSQSTKDLLCYMTEIQLQALLDATGVPGDTLTTDTTTLPDGRKVSKFDLAAMKLGAHVPPHIKSALLKFCKKST